jgi:hypothetical protein
MMTCLAETLCRLASDSLIGRRLGPVQSDLVCSGAVFNGRAFANNRAVALLGGLC